MVLGGLLGVKELMIMGPYRIPPLAKVNRLFKEYY
jgi:hypothetical protein